MSMIKRPCKSIVSISDYIGLLKSLGAFSLRWNFAFVLHFPGRNLVMAIQTSEYLSKPD